MGARQFFSLSRVGRVMVAPHNTLSSLGWTAVAVLVPTALRAPLDVGANGVPFVTYFPAIVLAGLFLGWRYGLLTAILSALTARMLFLESSPRLAGSAEGIAILALFVFSCAALLGIAEALRRSMKDLAAASDREQLLNAELRHRLKNVLSIVTSLAALQKRHADPAQAHEAFVERIVALSRAVDLLGTDGPRACALPDLAEEALEPFLPAFDIRLAGPVCRVERASCVPAVLAFHELATNAVKHGALAAPGGWVEISWSEEEDGMIPVQWCEHGGPPVRAPSRRGMGSKILAMQSEAARFALDFPTAGVICKIALKSGD